MRTILLVFTLLYISNCDQKMSNSQSAHTNRLINEASPYLRQHAENPVEWYPWGDEALAKAKEENKPILLSIGYSSCHWCHVMAHESFENDTIAQFMNAHFINIKLDREERPDIDQIYMEAVQNMGLRGGWPLNVFLTPDQKPFYGGTYFPPDQWKKLLENVAEAYTENYDKLYESATRFAESMQQSEVLKYGLETTSSEVNKKDFDQAFDTLSTRFDQTWGGIQKAPKFPMPSLWEFLGNYYALSGSEQAKKHLLFTLDKMAAGGIYDQIGGGFARYSVDGEWHVPHFEKMLYDNGQLLSLYATGHKLSEKDTYRKVLLQTAEWLQREMMSESGGFYSALDADSEGEEGKFYVWSFDEVKTLAGDHLSIMAEYYDVSKSGNWEGRNVLRRLEQDEQLASELNLKPEDLQQIIHDFNLKALKEREKRVRPGLDDKIISGWNGLVLSGLCKAYQATGDSLFIELANKNAAFIANNLITTTGLLRISDGNTQGFLEDYSAVIKGFIDYYETTFNENYLQSAQKLTDQVIETFYDESEGFFYYTSDQSERLIARKKEVFDNVIPSSNSMMANNLYQLGTMLDQDSYKDKAIKMVQKVNHMIRQEPEYLSNWGITAMMMAAPTPEILIIGDSAKKLANELHRHYIPNKVLLAATAGSKLPLFEYKEPINDRTTIFVCYNKTCRQPVFTIREALREIEKN